MSKLIQLGYVPDALHRGLRARAATAGMSLSDYLLVQIKEIAERPTLAELRERLHKRKPVSAQIDIAHLVPEEREAMIVLDASAIATLIDRVVRIAASSRPEY